MNGSGNILVPHVTRLPEVNRAEPSGSGKGTKTNPGEFDAVFKNAIEQGDQALKFSAHAVQRLKDRGIRLDQELMSRIRDGVDKAAAKGVQDGLVVTRDGAFIVSVENRTVITALDPEKVSGSVFTNIDGAVFV